MEWHDSYCIGVENIDAQHKKLFEVVSRLQKALSSSEVSKEVVGTLIFLVKYTKEHFADEEELMEAIAYPGLAAQRKLHSKLITEVDAAIAAVKQRRPIDIYKLVDFLIDWLVNHVEREDRKIGDFIAKIDVTQP